jgi:hypothetical protein
VTLVVVTNILYYYTTPDTCQKGCTYISTMSLTAWYHHTILFHCSTYVSLLLQCHGNTSFKFYKHYILTKSPLRELLFSYLKFEQSREAALHNAIILDSFNFDVNKSIRAQQGSQVFYGSEFKDPSMLQELLEHHPHWGSLQKILQHGANFPLLPLDPENHQKDLLFHREHGNQNSADKQCDKLDMIISNEIQQGFALLLPVEIFISFLTHP